PRQARLLAGPAAAVRRQRPSRAGLLRTTCRARAPLLLVATQAPPVPTRVIVPVTRPGPVRPAARGRPAAGPCGRRVPGGRRARPRRGRADRTGAAGRRHRTPYGRRAAGTPGRGPRRVGG